MIFEILGQFVNTLTYDEKYFLRNGEKLPQLMVKRFSKKQKVCSQLSAAILKSTSNVEHFFKKDEPHNCPISEIRECD